ncbi:asparagine synthetase B [Xenorhabdus sp. PR6a]|uniref:asparagine synthetase B family protein n=1 Tax=Xenorhabdus sp. PR6a TaxID=3025877 RepID=UPI002359710B|nr:asparagine synthetase B [Xenorhabdus sp. PR6a]MDC9581606.1 asparagine synthetase B [Xenorhabdus sp. PR6a]
MCGILGYIGEGFELIRFRQALKQLHHRGPFGEGIVTLPKGAMGMTRLPMSSAEPVILPVKVGEKHVAYNGEVYAPGQEINGEICLLLDGIAQGSLPDGMYTLAAWHPQTSSLTLLRDIYGIKPLYYCYQETQGRLCFSSELMPLLTMLGRRSPDTEAIAQVIAAGVTLDGQTLFSGIRLAGPGEQLTFTLDGERAHLVQRYQFKTSIQPATESLEETLSQAINQCKTTFRPSALLLSGGVDSNLLNTWLDVDFPKFTLELEYAREEIHSQTNLHRVSLTQPTFMSVLRQAVKNFGGATRMSSLLMYQQLADAIGDAGYHCVLLGEGADELFWGYPRHLTLWQHPLTFTPRTFAQTWFGDYHGNAALFSTSVAAKLCDQIDTLSATILRNGHEEAIAHFDLHYSLEPLLRRADHLFMSRTIEARTPYLHAGLGHLARRSARIVDGIAKFPLCNLLQQRFPDWQWQPKQHFRLPFAHWPLAVNEMRSHLHQTCSSLHNLGLVNLNSVHIDAMDSSQLFTLTTLSLWQQEYEGYL